MGSIFQFRFLTYIQIGLPWSRFHNSAYGWQRFNWDFFLGILSWMMKMNLKILMNQSSPLLALVGDNLDGFRFFYLYNWRNTNWRNTNWHAIRIWIMFLSMCVCKHLWLLSESRNFLDISITKTCFVTLISKK